MSILKKILSLFGISRKEEPAKPSIKPEPDSLKEFERYKGKKKFSPKKRVKTKKTKKSRKRPAKTRKRKVSKKKKRR